MRAYSSGVRPCSAAISGVTRISVGAVAISFYAVAFAAPTSASTIERKITRPSAEPRAAVGDHRAGKQASFAQNLEPVAHAKNQAAAICEFFNRLHHRRKARDGAGAQVVAVGESARQDDGVAIREIFRSVPDEFDGLFEDVSDGVKGVVVAVGPGKNNDSKFHAAAAPWCLAGTPILAHSNLSQNCGRNRVRGGCGLLAPLCLAAGFFPGAVA